VRLFRLIIRGRNCGKYLNECLESLQRQTIQNWYALVIADPSKDNTVEKLVEWAAREPRIRVIVNPEPYGVCRNMWQGLREIGNPYQAIRAAIDNDVVGILDLDDYLYRPTSLEIVAGYYKEHPEIMATYGTFRFGHGHKSKLCQKYHSHDKPRKARWMASHLKTFKYAVVKHIPQDYFMYHGRWGEGASDLALMFCVMERVGLARVKRIKESIYYYRTNISNSLSRRIQRKYNKIWRKKKPLTRRF